MDLPQDLKYTNSHEWIRVEADGTVAVGITFHAQEALGDLVHIDMPAVGAEFDAGTECLVVESVKAAADVYAPVSGKIIAINEALDGAAEKVNEDPYGSWLFKMALANPAELDGLLDAAAYKAVEEA